MPPKIHVHTSSPQVSQEAFFLFSCLLGKVHRTLRIGRLTRYTCFFLESCSCFPYNFFSVATHVCLTYVLAGLRGPLLSLLLLSVAVVVTAAIGNTPLVVDDPSVPAAAAPTGAVA